MEARERSIGPNCPQDAQAHALLGLLRLLDAGRYRFITPTPATHARVRAKLGRDEARSVEDVLGWSLPFAPELLPPATTELLRRAGAIEDAADGRCRATIRVSALCGRLFLHSAYPTDAEDAVFFGPDSYRFAALIADELVRDPPPASARIVDIGSGAGVGAIVAASIARSPRLIATDVNGKALALAAVNAAAAGVALETIETAGMQGVAGEVDVAMLNPPFIADEGERQYRHGGGMHGGQLSLDLACEAMGRLVPGGRVILYTGSAIVDGKDALRAALDDAVDQRGFVMRYRELDPDVFGEELEQPAYSNVDRIALVAAIVTRPGL